jgi:hypothetical protein
LFVFQFYKILLRPTFCSSDKIMFLEMFDMYLMVFDIFCHDFVKIRRKST